MSFLFSVLSDMASGCIDPRALRSYVRGESSDTDVATIEEHLSSCRDCQARVERLAEAPDSTLQAIAHAVALAQDRQEMHAGRTSQRQRTAVDLDSRATVGRPAAFSAGESDAAHSKAEYPMETIRDYRILDCIGQGGMGTVYRAWHGRLNRMVALKIIKSDRLESDEANSRFAREMRLLARLDHPQIVRALDAGELEGLQYFVMEFVPGVDLGQLLRRLGPLPIPEVCGIASLTAAALGFAHGEKVIHRDIKPSNLMITPDGNVKLLDLGLAQLFDLPTADASISTAGQAVGTVAYMPPELLAGNTAIAPTMDVYSLGITLCEMLTGFRPFEFPGGPLMVRDISSLRPDAPKELNQLVQSMIAFDPAERPQTMQVVEGRLAEIVAQADLVSLVAEYYRWGNRMGRTSSVPPVQSAVSIPQSLTAIPPAMSAAAQAGPLVRYPRRSVMEHAGWFVGIVSAFLLLWWIVADNWTHEVPRPQPDGNAFLEVPSGPPGEAAEEEELLAPEFESEPAVPVSLLEVSPVGDVVKQLLDEGRVRVESVEDQSAYFLAAGQVELPPGEYRIHFDAPVAFVEQGEVFRVVGTTPTQLNLRATLVNRFQFPSIPTRAGAFARYYGTFWRQGWEPNRKVVYDLTLKVLCDHSTSSTAEPNWWLKAKVMDLGNPNGYAETAFLRFDRDQWERDPVLHVFEGFIEYSGAIVRDSNIRGTELKVGESLVLPFESDRDVVASIDGLQIPEQRLSVHDALALFFGADHFSAADEGVRKLRGELAKPGSRNAWLADIDDGTGPVSCYVVSSGKRGQSAGGLGYSIARRDDGVFGFVELGVELPTIKVTCMLKNQSHEQQGRYDRDWTRISHLPDLVLSPADLQKELEPIPQTELSGKPFDLAVLPPEPATVEYHGTISRRGDSENLSIRLTMFGDSEIRGRSVSWLEMQTVSTTAASGDHSEWARLAIDTAAYEGRQEIKLMEGWIAYGDRGNVYPIPANSDLSSLFDARIQRQTPDAFDRIGVVDAMSLLFAAELRPRSDFAKLRSSIAGLLTGRERKPRIESRSFKSFGEIEGEVWEQPAGSPVPYEFFRSAEVPFGFVSATLKVPMLVQLGLELKTYGPAAEESIFGSAEELQNRISANQKFIESKRREGWRVWTWDHGGKVHKTWAEFAGVFEYSATKFVVLANSANQTIRVPYSELSAEDRQFADEGRGWAAYSSEGDLKFTLEAYSLKPGGKALLARKYQKGRDLAVKRTLQIDSMMTADREWIERLDRAKKNSLRMQDVVAEWPSFPVHVVALSGK
ncbi:MAG: serine/threonine protein kinase [bacterium]|nr:serine/threonine protein kinase [bacterium]